MYGRWVVLRCLLRLNLVEATSVSRQAEGLTPDGAEFLAVALEDRTWHRLRLIRLGMLQVPILVDPLLRLHRSHGVGLGQASTRCRPFFVGPDGLLCFHLVHDLNGRGLHAIAEILCLFHRQQTAALASFQRKENRLMRQKVSSSHTRAMLNICGCGRLHLTYGLITLHFEPEEFLAFGEAVTQMVAQFRRIQRDQLVPSMPPKPETVCH